eukprot:533350_1
MDLAVCYPPVTYTPYWTIIFGFFSSTLITYISYISGSGLFSILKYLISCKCCKSSDLNQSNKWKQYPQVINISNANPFKPIEEISPFCGNYQLQDHNPDLPPFYTHQNAMDTRGTNCLRYINNGWSIVYDWKQQYKHELTQSETFFNQHFVERGSISTELTTLPLLHNIVKSSNTERNKAFNALNIHYQNFVVHQTTEIPLSKVFWTQNVKHSNFMHRQRDSDTNHRQAFNDDTIPQNLFKVEEHWIEFTGFQTYCHNVWNYNVLDINGKYLLYEVTDLSHLSDMGVTFYFQHERIKGLFFQYLQLPKCSNSDVFEASISFNPLGKLVDFYEQLKYQRNKQYMFNGKTEVTLSIKEKVAWRLYGENLIRLMLLCKVIYQAVLDCGFFVKYVQNKDVTSWFKYECYCSILMNSSNAKQLFVLVTCLLMSNESMKVSNSTFIGKLLFFVYFLCITLGFAPALPCIVTHTLPFIFIYCWIFIILFPFFQKTFWRSKTGHWLKTTLWKHFRFMTAFSIGFIVYLVYTLWPVETMIRFYNGEGYIYSLYSVFYINDRNTNAYIIHHFSKIEYLRQLFLWLF